MHVSMYAIKPSPFFFSSRCAHNMPSPPTSRQSVAFERFVDLIGQLAGGRPVGFDDAVFESERTTGVRNYEIADRMRPEHIFPADANVDEALLFYFSQCAIQLDIQSLAHLAATCANRGKCPTSGRVVARPDTVVAMLRLMYFWYHVS
jgi:glutaminase